MTAINDMVAEWMGLHHCLWVYLTALTCKENCSQLGFVNNRDRGCACIMKEKEIKRKGK